MIGLEFVSFLKTVFRAVSVAAERVFSTCSIVTVSRLLQFTFSDLKKEKEKEVVSSQNTLLFVWSDSELNQDHQDHPKYFYFPTCSLQTQPTLYAVDVCKPIGTRGASACWVDLGRVLSIFFFFFYRLGFNRLGSIKRTYWCWSQARAGSC